jgi:hypothetical protein
MLKKLTLSLVVFLVMASLTFGQNALENGKHKVQKVDPSQESVLNNAPVKTSPTISADLFTTDYDYAGNNSRPTMLWPYDVDADNVLDPIGTGMQRADGGTRSNQLFAGLGGEFTWFPVSDPALNTGWGGIQSLTEGPWAGKALVMMHQGGKTKYSLVDLATFGLDVTHADVDADNSTNFPYFVYLPDGKIFWVSDAGNLFQSTDQLASSTLVTNVIPQEATDAPAEFVLKRSPNGQYVFHPAAFSVAGSILDGVEQDSADFVSAYYSVDGGANFTFEKIGYEGYSPIDNRDYMPLFANFAQIDGAVDNTGKMHAVINGYSVDLGSVDTAAVFPVYYWNSERAAWTAVTTVAQETTPEILTYYPGNGIGNAYPTVAVNEDGSVVVVVYQSPEVVGGALNLYPGDGGAASTQSYYTDLYYVMSTDGGQTFGEPVKLAGEANQAEYYPYVAATGLEPVGDNEYRLHYVYFVDVVPGTSLFGENDASNDGYWVYDSMDFLAVSVDDELTTVSNFELAQNYPNPFNPTTKISYSVADQTMVTLKVYDVLGKEVATLVNEVKAAGQYNVSFNAANLATGMYIYKLQAGDFVSSKKMMLVK